MKQTKNPAKVAAALGHLDADGLCTSVVKVGTGGRSWHVNSVGQGERGWWMRLSHPDFPQSRCDAIDVGQVFHVYTQAQYAGMLEVLRKEEENV